MSTSATVEGSEDKSAKNSSLPSGLTNAHLMKLRFLGIDPRSPSSEIVRTPIQVFPFPSRPTPPISVFPFIVLYLYFFLQLGKGTQRDVSPCHFDDTLSVGSVSSHDIFNNSLCSSEFIRDCSDPSAFLSENEDLSDKDDDVSPVKTAQV